jgi:hypothetical protein
VEYGHGALIRIDHDDGKAVRGLNRQHWAGRIGHQAVAHQGVIRHGTHAMDDIGVYLPERNHRRRAAAVNSQPQEKGRSIALDRGFGVGLRKTQIQGVAAVRSGVPARARGKAVDQPGYLSKPASLKESQPGFWAGPGRHSCSY